MRTAQNGSHIQLIAVLILFSSHFWPRGEKLKNQVISTNAAQRLHFAKGPASAAAAAAAAAAACLVQWT